MDFEEYQREAKKTAIHPEQYRIIYPALGLCGEAGEVANKVKKIFRDGVEPNKEEITKELGDCLWYLAALASDLDISLNEIGEQNIAKLRSRQERGVLKGSGDNR